MEFHPYARIRGPLTCIADKSVLSHCWLSPAQSVHLPPYLLPAKSARVTPLRVLRSHLHHTELAHALVVGLRAFRLSSAQSLCHTPCQRYHSNSQMSSAPGRLCLWRRLSNLNLVCNRGNRGVTEVTRSCRRLGTSKSPCGQALVSGHSNCRSALEWAEPSTAGPPSEAPRRGARTHTVRSFCGRLDVMARPASPLPLPVERHRPTVMSVRTSASRHLNTVIPEYRRLRLRNIALHHQRVCQAPISALQA